MADLNALIAQGAQFRQAPDPFVQYGQMQQLEQNQQTNALNQMKMQEAQATMAERNALRQLNPSAADYESQLFKVNPTLGIAYRKEASAAGASKAAQQLSEAKTIETKQQILGQAYRDLSNRPDDEHIVTYGRDVQGSTLFSDAEKATVAARVTQLLKMPVEERKALLASQGAKSSELNRPPVILGPGQIAIPGNDPRLTGTGVTAPAAAAKPPDKIAIMTALGYPLTPGGNEAYETAIRAKSTVSAPTGTLAEMEATGIPKTQEGLALYYRLKEKAPVVAPEARTTEERNAELIALGAGPKGSPEFNAALRAEVLRMTAKPVAAPESTTPDIKNATALALLKGERGSAAFNKEFVKQMEKSTTKSGGGGGGEAVPKAPSGYRVTKSGDLEAIPGGPAAGKPMTDLQKQGLKKDFAADTSKIKAAVDTADEMEKLTDDLVGNPDKKIAPHPGLSGIKGFQGLLASFPESPVTSGNAAKAEQKLETFKGKIKALGRSIASLDGKLGNMAVQEWQMVSDSVQAIKPTAGNLDEQMRDAVRQARLLAKNLRDKFDLTYEDTAPAAAPGTPAPAAVGGIPNMSDIDAEIARRKAKK